MYNEVGIKVEPVVGLKQGKYASKKKEKIGSISVLKDCVEFHYRVNGERKRKRYKVSKKRSLTQAK